MLKKLLAGAALLFSLHANATVISVDLDKASYEVGETISANLVLSDIQTLVIAFDAKLDFNQDLVEFRSVSFGDFLSLPGLDKDRVANAQNGQIDLFEMFMGFAIEDLFDLQAKQPSTSFVLATVTFKAIKHGMSHFGLSGLQVTYDDIANGTYTDEETRGVAANTLLVSSPATWLLLLPALWLMRRRQQ